MSKKVNILRDKDGYFVLRAANGCRMAFAAIPDIFTIQPNTSEYQNLISNLNNSQRMAASWQRTGNQMRRAMSGYKVKNGNKKEKFAYSN